MIKYLVKGLVVLFLYFLLKNITYADNYDIRSMVDKSITQVHQLSLYVLQRSVEELYSVLHSNENKMLK